MTPDLQCTLLPRWTPQPTDAGPFAESARAQGGRHPLPNPHTTQCRAPRACTPIPGNGSGPEHRHRRKMGPCPIGADIAPASMETECLRTVEYNGTGTAGPDCSAHSARSHQMCPMAALHNRHSAAQSITGTCQAAHDTTFPGCLASAARAGPTAKKTIRQRSS